MNDDERSAREAARALSKAREDHLQLADDLVTHALNTHRRPDVRWICAARVSRGRGGCTLLRAWRVPRGDDVDAVVEIPAVRRGGNSMYLDRNDREPATRIWLGDFEDYWGRDDSGPLPALVRCDHFRLLVPTRELDTDLRRAASDRRSVLRTLDRSVDPSDTSETVHAKDSER